MNIITKAQREELTAKIEPLLEQVAVWRKNKTSHEAMPEPLWEAAVALAKVYGVSPVQGILRIDYRGLERRTLGMVKPPAGKARPAAQSFIELPAASLRRAEHTVELEDGTGRRLTVRVLGGDLAEVLPVVQAFWRPGV